jgi:hypothetical protein
MNYDIVMRFEDQSGVFPVDGESIIGLGLLARLKRERRAAQIELSVKS